MAFNKYFQDEISYLRDLGREFSSAYPQLAPMLADRGGDPDVERLLEGIAFLTGRIRQKLDDELPELMFTIAQLLFPHLTKPLPGASILEVKPLPNVLRELRTMAAGTEFHSVPVDGINCRFRSTNDLVLSPWTIREVRLEDLQGGAQQLRIEFTIPAGLSLEAVVPDTLRLHLAGEQRSALAILTWLCAHAAQVSVVEPRLGAAEEEVLLPPGSIQAAGFSDAEALLPFGETAFPGFRLLEEYYVLPAKFQFVDIKNVRKALALGSEVTTLGILIKFDRPLTSVRQISKENIKLHCVPVVNVFQTTAEPIRVKPEREQHLVRPAGLAPGYGEIYEITHVETIAKGSNERVEIPPFFEFAHADRMSTYGRVYYALHQRPSVVGDAADTFISLGTAENSGVTPDVDMLSIDLLATNGRLANAVRAGEIKIATPSSPPFVTFSNLSAVTPHVSPPMGHELQWRVTAHGAMSLRSLLEVEVLRSVMAVYNLHAIVDQQAARANELRIQAVKSVDVSPAEKLYHGAPIRGVAIKVELDETGFAGEGDLYLFGSVLERFFSGYVSLNSFSVTTVRAVRSNLVFTWPARSGSLTLL